jgi:superfamily II DNA/RNA helicase
MTFKDLGIANDLVEVLRRGGIVEPTPIQALTVAEAINGRDVCGKARTGSGKTLAFGLPLIERTGRSAPRRPRSLVLVPTRELATQILEALRPLAIARKMRLGAIYGGTSINRQADMLRAGVDIAIATPGRMFDLLQRGALTLADIEMVVIDEADQMADLGFLPQVERILDQAPEGHQTLLFSATLDGAIGTLIRKYQHDPLHFEATSEDELDSAMEHRFIGVDFGDKTNVAAAITAGPQRTIMFARTQRGAERIVRDLGRAGVEAGVIHGGLSQPKRERALHAFSRGHVRVLVATNIAARGIHVDGIDMVVHHDAPEDAKTYLHRSGRTARAGAAGLVITLVEPGEVRAINQLRREAGVREAVVPMGASDPRLADLGAWMPPLDDHSQRPAPANRDYATQQGGQPSGGRRRSPQGGYGGNRRRYDALSGPNARGRGPQGGPARSFQRSNRGDSQA